MQFSKMPLYYVWSCNIHQNSKQYITLEFIYFEYINKAIFWYNMVIVYVGYKLMLGNIYTNFKKKVSGRMGDELSVFGSRALNINKKAHDN